VNRTIKVSCRSAGLSARCLVHISQSFNPTPSKELIVTCSHKMWVGPSQPIMIKFHYRGTGSSGFGGSQILCGLASQVHFIKSNLLD
jgi:hypothetical protein